MRVMSQNIIWRKMTLSFGKAASSIERVKILKVLNLVLMGMSAKHLYQICSVKIGIQHLKNLKSP